MAYGRKSTCILSLDQLQSLACGSLGVPRLRHYPGCCHLCHHIRHNWWRTFCRHGRPCCTWMHTWGGQCSDADTFQMSYALQITQSLNWIVRQTVEVETNIVSVERVLEYATLPSEAPDVLFKSRPSIGWPAHGQITFENYSTRYREGLDPVLKDINLSIKAREKIGVVGRTGAGKSSLTLALFRIIEPISGHIR